LRLLIGWKIIGNIIGLGGIATTRKLARKYKMPIHYLNNRPAISDRDLSKWWDNLKQQLPKKHSLQI